MAASHADGKTVVAGGFDVHINPFTGSDLSAGFALVRYNTNGSLDSTFGNSGIVTTTFAITGSIVAAEANALVLQPDGKIIAGGYAVYSCGLRCDTYGFALARYNPNGTLDVSFGNGGRVLTPRTRDREVVMSLALQSDYKLVVAGTVSDRYGFAGSFALARYNTNGTLDNNFGAAGRVTTGFSSESAEARSVIVGAGGTIVAAGYSGNRNPGNRTFALAGYLPNGSLDNGFGIGGRVITEFESGSAEIQDLEEQPDGKLIVVGGSSGDFALARYNQNGTLDPTFGNGGKVVTQLGLGGIASAISLQPDGKSVVGGDAITNSDGADFAAARYFNVEPPLPTPTIGPGCVFSDVCPSDYFFTAVQYLINLGAISGYSDNTFRPYNNTTRGQLCKIVVLAEGWTLINPPTPTFSDVPITHAFYTYVETAFNQGILSGYADGTFRPGNDVSRGQICKIVVLAEEWELYVPPIPTFIDVPSTDPFYAYVETAYHHDVISGYSCGMACLEFRPGNNATRGQICKIIYNALTLP